ncbi:MAG: hypothetical protein U0821_21315 [Chloroflexota bacterium]
MMLETNNAMDQSVAGSAVVTGTGSGAAETVVREGTPHQPSAEPHLAGASANPAPELVPIERVRGLQSVNDKLRLRVDDLERQLNEANGLAASAGQALSELQGRALVHLRRALLAEHAGQLVPELVVGETPEALEASVEVARAAFARVADTARANLSAQMVLAGTPPRTHQISEPLTPLDRIVAGLKAM